jgi:hypothetical protein
MVMVDRARGVLAGVFALVVAAAAEAQPVRISVAADGTEANGDSNTPVLSANGRFVAFASAASNLVAGDTNGVDDVFLRDRDTDADGVFDEPAAVSTVRVSQLPAVQGNGTSRFPRITPDGRYVFFESQASSLFAVNQPVLAFSVVLRWDRATGAIVLVSQNAAGEPLNGSSTSPAATADGNTVYFVTRADNIDGGDIGFGGLIVRRDISQSTLTRISQPLPRGNDVFGHQLAALPSVSDDGSVYCYAIVLDNLGPIGGTTHVVRAGQERTQSGRGPQLSADGQFLTDTQAYSPVPLFRQHLPTGERLPLPGEARFTKASRSGRYLAGNGVLADVRYGSAVPLPIWSDPSFSDGDTHLAHTVTNFVPGRSIADVVVVDVPYLVERDSDGLNDHWEWAFGLSFAIGTGDNGAAGDPDHDGRTNAQEFADGSNPTQSFTKVFAEGSSSPDFFTTRYAFLNRGAYAVSVAARFDRGAGMAPVTRVYTIPPLRRVTIDSHLEGLDTSSFTATFESSLPTLAVDRLMTWGHPGVPYGSHAEHAQSGGSTQWFLAEGSTVLGFQLFYLLQNPQPTATVATVRFLLPSGAPVVRTYDLPPQSRTTIYVNAIPSLESTDVSADITAPVPIGVERAMYRSAAGQVFALGHAAAGVQSPSTTWHFAEGATGAFFDTYFLFANPTSTTATVQVEYLRDAGGSLTRTYTVPAQSRFTIYADAEPGLASANFGARVTSDVGIVAERTMYWPGGFFDYYEAHVSAGSPVASGFWSLAEGEVGGPFGAETYVLIANTAAEPITLRANLYSDNSDITGYTHAFTLPAHTRASLPFSGFPSSIPGAPPPEGRFGVVVFTDLASPPGLVVEGALYWHVPGQPFAAGANWLATPGQEYRAARRAGRAADRRAARPVASRPAAAGTARRRSPGRSSGWSRGRRAW